MKARKRKGKKGNKEKPHVWYFNDFPKFICASFASKLQIKSAFNDERVIVYIWKKEGRLKNSSVCETNLYVPIHTL